MGSDLVISGGHNPQLVQGSWDLVVLSVGFVRATAKPRRAASTEHSGCCVLVHTYHDAGAMPRLPGLPFSGCEGRVAGPVPGTSARAALAANHRPVRESRRRGDARADAGGGCGPALRERAEQGEAEHRPPLSDLLSAVAVAQRRGRIPALVTVGEATDLRALFRGPNPDQGAGTMDLHVLSRRPIDAPEG